MGQKISLQGEWGFCLDGAKEGIKKQYYRRQPDDTIFLPGTTAKAQKGVCTAGGERETDHLTERFHFEGYAWYSKRIALDALPEHALLFLRLERTRISHVWVDGRDAGSRDSLCAGHVYDLTGFMDAGEHTLTILVSNVDYPVPGGHMTSPDTQTNWNGILGEISLEICGGLAITQVRVFADYAKRRVRAQLQLKCASGLSRELTLRALCRRKADGEKILRTETRCLPKDGGDALYAITLEFPEEAELLPWNEFTPSLYELCLEAEAGAFRDSRTVTFGFRDLHIRNGRFYVNDLELFLRGKQEALTFPLTGYAPMDREAWLRVFSTAKEYGLNHYRFHTCCPPEAAFCAADELGVYLEPEIPFWGSILSEDDPEYAASGQEFLTREGFAILDEFGNHPSFVLFSMGNELWGSREALSKRMALLKAHDPRHWYTEGSNNFQFAPTTVLEDDFFCGVRFSRERLFRGSYAMCDAPQGHIQLTEPENCYTYDEMIRPKTTREKTDGQREVEIQYHTGVKKVRLDEAEEMILDMPVVSHEVGQYAMYPNFREMEKYTGVLQPENFRVFQERLREKGMEDMAQAFFEASGHLAVQCYKRELEAAFRSRELAGFQLLDLQDFPGQGTALVGILDAFLESKGLIEPESWRQFCSDRVLTLAFPRFVYKAGEAFSFNLLFCDQNPEELPEGEARVCLTDREGKVCAVWSRAHGALRQTRLQDLGSGELLLPAADGPRTYQVRAELTGTKIRCEYEIYVYPQAGCASVTGKETQAGCTFAAGKETQAGCAPAAGKETQTEPVIAAEKGKLAEALRQGRRVLYLGAPARGIQAEYCTDFWCYPMFASISEQMGKEKPVGTLGLCIDPKHPALALFPCETYTTPPWWSILQGAQLGILDDAGLRPIVWGIDNFARNHRLGLLYECRVGEGSVLICHAPLLGETLPEAWLKKSLLAYLGSPQFRPEQECSLEEALSLLR